MPRKGPSAGERACARDASRGLGQERVVGREWQGLAGPTMRSRRMHLERGTILRGIVRCARWSAGGAQAISARPHWVAGGRAALGSSDEAAATRARTSMLRSCTRTAFPFGFRTGHGQRFSGRSKHRTNQLGEDWPSQRQWPTATRRIENGTPPARSARTGHAGCPPKAAGKKVVKSLRRCPREGSPLR